MDERAFRAVKRACYAGLDSVALRREAARRIAGAVGHDAYAFSTHDPETGLIAHLVAANVPVELAVAYATYLYPHHAATAVIDAVARGEVFTTLWEEVPEVRVASRGAGMRQEFCSYATADGQIWGSWCFLRYDASAGPPDRERALLARLGPHLARGIQSAALLETARRADARGESSSPGVLVVDHGGSISLRTAAAATHLQDLADVGLPDGADVLPIAVSSVLARLRSVAAEARDGVPTEAALNTRGRSGRWYRIRATFAEPDDAGRTAAVVLIRPMMPREMAPVLARLYGLSTREREIVAAVARGHSTKRIASLLGLSPHTVREHLDRASSKVGVHGRKALVARLFFDGYAPHLRDELPPTVS
jgi:DNA-binding CsgD family transcriptional regulator